MKKILDKKIQITVAAIAMLTVITILTMVSSMA